MSTPCLSLRRRSSKTSKIRLLFAKTNLQTQKSTTSQPEKRPNLDIRNQGRARTTPPESPKRLRRPNNDIVVRDAGEQSTLNRAEIDDDKDRNVALSASKCKPTENKFETLKDTHITIPSEIAPPSPNNQTSQTSQAQSQPVDTAQKLPPASQPSKQKSSSKIPNVAKSGSVARASNNSHHDETKDKKHKGKTPSFGSANTPLFMSHIQLDPHDVHSAAILKSAANTPSYASHEDRLERRTFMKAPPAAERFVAPVLSHRDHKRQTKKVTRPAHRGQNRQSSKASPSAGKLGARRLASAEQGRHHRYCVAFCQRCFCESLCDNVRVSA